MVGTALHSLQELESILFMKEAELKELYALLNQADSHISFHAFSFSQVKIHQIGSLCCTNFHAGRDSGFTTWPRTARSASQIFTDLHRRYAQIG